MTKFFYKARSSGGASSSGALDAQDTKEAALQLEAEGLVPIAISSEDEEVPINFSAIKKGFDRIKPEELILFNRQLHSLLNAGVTLVESLVSLHDQIKSEKLKKIIYAVKEDVETGTPFSGALAKYPDVFSDLIANMVKAGEKSGTLTQSLDRIVMILEKEQNAQKRMFAAVRYPMFVLAALSVAFAVVITLIIPRFGSVYASLGGALPLPTRILISIGNTAKNYWYIVLLLAAAGAYIFKKWAETPYGRQQVDRTALSVPVIGDVLTKITLSRFCRTLSAMFDSGLTATEALSVGSKIAGNTVISSAVDGIKDEIIKGESFSSAMKKKSIFPPVVVQMVAVGEKTGNLSDMLSRVADYFDRETDYTIDNMTALIEPFLILFLGLMVLLLALGVFLPMWNLMQLYQY